MTKPLDLAGIMARAQAAHPTPAPVRPELTLAQQMTRNAHDLYGEVGTDEPALTPCATCGPHLDALVARIGVLTERVDALAQRLDAAALAALQERLKMPIPRSRLS